MEGESFAFLNALASETNMNNYEIETTGQSISELIIDSKVASDDIRCICGFHAGSGNLIQCKECKKFLHRTCISISDDFNISNFLCPFCMYQKYHRDPLASIENAFDIFNHRITEISLLLRQLDGFQKRAKSIHDELQIAQITPQQKMQIDEIQKSITIMINNLNNEIKKRSKILHEMEAIMFSDPLTK